LKSTSRSKNLRSVFQSDMPSDLYAHIAQLCVLYEDLRIEVLGAGEEDMGELDGTDARCRRYYFLRRSIATLQEFSCALVSLNRFADFAIIRNRFNEEIQSIWQQSVQFFRQHKHHLSGVRNDVGGHFGLKAARYAVENFRPGVAGTFELNEIRRRGATRTEIRLKFAGEIVATATFSSLPGTTEEESSKKEYDRLWRIVKEGYKRATEAAHVVAVCHLWGRFG